MEDCSAAFEAKRRALLEAGVKMMDPSTVYVEDTVTVGEGTLLLPGTILRGRTVVGKNCEIGPNTMLTDCTVEDGVVINSSQCSSSTIRAGAHVGPFAYIRPDCTVGERVKVGDFVELKNSTIGSGTKISHLTYVGDCDVGSRVNFGCGTVIVNYDGNRKYRSTIGDDCFLGCNTNLVSPVRLGNGAFTAAGSTITHDVEADALSVARARQVDKPGWAIAHRAKKGK